MIRQQCATPIAMGELFNNPREWRLLIEERLIDFIRMHVSQMGGITPARNAAIHAQVYGIRTAWHGPGDTSPVGHAANLHLDLWAPNFGIQEWCRFDSLVYDMFPGLPEVRDGYMYPNDKPGLGIDFDEALAAKYPCTRCGGYVDADPPAGWQPDPAVGLGDLRNQHPHPDPSPFPFRKWRGEVVGRHSIAAARRGSEEQFQALV